MKLQDTIAAYATAPGVGAIAILRLSGPDAIAITEKFFVPVNALSRKRGLSNLDSHTIHLGHIVRDGNELDEVLVSLFHNPRSYTGEDVVEISCHGSPYIQRELLSLVVNHGARVAEPGEFTLRSFMNGKMNLSQAEAVGDLIASESAASHQVAMAQMRGGFVNELAQLRTQLMDFASLIELELDFAGEDVEFASRDAFRDLLSSVTHTLRRLIDSFATGNVMKEGVPVAIIGAPNVGKSSLLNALLNEERAIVSDIAGTTRDTIEENINLGGYVFRFVDTAGLRATTDHVENVGITKAKEKLSQARAILLMATATEVLEDPSEFERLHSQAVTAAPDAILLPLINKTDALDAKGLSALETVVDDSKFSNQDGGHTLPVTFMSLENATGLDELEEKLVQHATAGMLQPGDSVVSNARHYNLLQRSLDGLMEVQDGLDAGVSSDLLAVDLRQALHFFGELTGQVTNDELLGNIFSNFCIGK